MLYIYILYSFQEGHDTNSRLVSISPFCLYNSTPPARPRCRSSHWGSKVNPGGIFCGPRNRKKHMWKMGIKATPCDEIVMDLGSLLKFYLIDVLFVNHIFWWIFQVFFSINFWVQVLWYQSFWRSMTASLSCRMNINFSFRWSTGLKSYQVKRYPKGIETGLLRRGLPKPVHNEWPISNWKPVSFRVFRVWIPIRLSG